MYKMGCFLSRLRADTRGNTLAIVGAALVPISAMIGAGVDMSRAYMAKSRLQNACDAGALAARRVMKSDNLNDTVTNTGKQFFKLNFPIGSYQTEAFEPVFSKPETGVVRIVATTKIPTSIMSMFGVKSLPVEATCDASLNFVNTDVVLVLDVTGSMLDSVPTDASGGTSQKIVAMREAVLALYDELAPVQTQLAAQGLRMRYGIVPYSSTVNVGRLVAAVNPNFIRNSTPYQTRVGNYTTAEDVANTPTTTAAWEVNSSSLSKNDCKNWVDAASVNGGGPKPTPTTKTHYDGSATEGSYVQATNWGYSGAPDTSSSERTCRRWKIVETTTYTRRFKFTNWTYEENALETSQFKTATGIINLATDTGGTVATSGPYNLAQMAASATGVGTSSYTWNGCIEERDTLPQVITLTPPTGAQDLNVNMIPNPADPATQWRPMLPEAIYAPANIWSVSGWTTTNRLADLPADRGYSACPSEARRLQVWDRGSLETYVNGLNAVGGTYHDIGMLWGARFVSPSGIFADSCDTFNNMPCNRHVIFMTDGQQTAYCNVSSAYGVERYGRRVLGSNNCTSDDQSNTTTQNLVERHRQRFRALCAATQNLQASVWVIAFDTSLNSDLTACASNADQAKTSINRADLINQFKNIGNKIGALRLTK